MLEDKESLLNQINNNVNSERESLARWYLVKTEPGKEYIVQYNLMKKMSNEIIGQSIFRVEIVEEEKEVSGRGKTPKKVKLVNKFPNHVFVKMIYSKEIWWEVVSTEGAYSFLGPDARPLALMKKEVYKLGLEKVPIEDFKVGDTIEILTGSFAKQITNIVSIDEAKETVKVYIQLLGSEQEIEVGIDNILKK